YEGGKRIADLDFDHLGDFKCRESGFIWIGLHEPSQEALATLQQRFNLHELAIEDAHSAHQRPKVEVYGDSLFVVLRTAQLVEWLEEHVFNDTFDQETVEHIYRLKRDLLSLRRAVAPVVEMSNRLMRFDMPLIDKHAHPYFRDIHDHAVLVNDSVDYLRELLN